MRLSDVVNQLRATLPKYTDIFSDVLGISSITASGGTATLVTSAPHNLITGANITIANTATRTPIIGVTQDGLTFTFETGSDHDLTLAWEEHENVSFDGFTDSAWNDSFVLLDVPNRRTFKVRSTNTIPTLAGAEVLLEVRIDGANGRWAANVINTTNFSISGNINDALYSGGVVASNPRIAGSINIDRAIEQYTAQELDDYWIFAVMSDAEVSKDRSTFSDAVSTPATGNAMRTRLVDGFSVFIFKDASESNAAVAAVDVCRHDLMLPLLKTVYGARFDTGLSGSADFRTVLLGHSAFDYNRAILIYEYQFQSSMDLTDLDAVEPEDTSAFRDIDYTHTIGGDDTEDLTGIINLDDEPL